MRVYHIGKDSLIVLFSYLQGCQRVAEDWQRIIQVRSLVVSPSEDMNTWLKYASLCRKNGRLVRFICITKACPYNIQRVLEL